MEFYRILARYGENPVEIEEAVEDLYLPWVRHPVCGHEISASGGIPFPLSSSSQIRRHTHRAGTPTYVSPDEWTELAAIIAKEIMESGHIVPPLYPGMRIGPLRIRAIPVDDMPDYLPCTPDYLHSRRLIDLFFASNFKRIEEYPAYVDVIAGRNTCSQPEYYELVTLAEAPLAAEARFHEKRCPICDKTLEIRYDSLLIDTNSWDGSDFVRPRGTLFSLVSERVRQAVESSGLTGMQLIPARRLSAGPGAKDMIQILADLEFERQIAERRALRRHEE